MGAAAVLRRLVPLLVTVTAAAFAVAATGVGPGAAAASPDSTLPNENEDVHILQPHAHTFIGAILPLRTRGSGLYGCGSLNKTSEVILEAMKRVLDAVNAGSAEPKIGVRIMDSCGRKRVAVDQLARMFPELQTGVDDPPLPQDRWLAGLVDGAGLADDAGDAGAALLAARVAVAPLREWLTVSSRVKAMMAVVRYLRWERVVVVRSENEDAGDALWKEWAATQSKDGPCMVAVERNVSAALSHSLPVIVLVPQAELSPLIQSINNHTSLATIFLANWPDVDHLNLPPHVTLLTLAPGRLPPTLDPEPNNLAGISLAEAIISAGQSLGLIALAVHRTRSIHRISRLEFLNSNFAPLAAAAARGDLPDGEGHSWKALILSPSSVNIVRLDDTTENVFRVDLASGVIHTLSPNSPQRYPQVQTSNATCLSAARTSGARRIEEQHSANSLNHEELHTLLDSPQGVYMVFFSAMHTSAKGRSTIFCPSFDHETADVVSARRLEAFLWALRRLNQQLAREDGSVQVGALFGDTCSSHILAMSLAARTPGNGRHGLAVVVNALPSSDAKVAADILADREITSIATNHLLDNPQGLPQPYTLQVETSLQNIVSSILKMLSHLGWSYVSIVHSSDPGSDHERGFHLFQSTAASHGVCIAATLDMSGTEDVDNDAVVKLVGARAEGARGVVVWADEEGSRRLFRAVARAVAQVTLRREDLFWFLASPLGDTGGVLDEFGNVVGGALVFGPHHRGVPEFQHHLMHLPLNNESAGSIEREWTRFYRQQCGKGPCIADHPSAIAGDWAVVQSVYAAGAALSKLARTGCAHSRPTCVFDGENVQIGEAVSRAVRQSISTRADGPAVTDYHFSSSGSGAIGVEVQNFRRRTGSRSRSLGDVFFQKVGVFSDERLSPLEDIVAYRDAGDEVSLSSLTSQCVGAESKCLRCRASHSKVNRTLGDWVVNWPDNKPPETTGKSKKVTVMVAATIAVHESSANPAQCGQTVSTAGVELLEAFLWAVDQVNRNWTDPGVKLGAITLDTCGSSLRTSRHVAELLSSESTPGSLVVALVAGGETWLAAPVADAAAAAGLPAMAPASRGPPPDRKTHPPYPLQLAPSSNKTASALVALISAIKRNCVGVLYLKDAVDYEETAIQLEKQLSVATSVSMIKSSLTASSAATRGSSATREAILRLRRPSRNTPSQVVVILAPPDHVDKVFSVVAGLNDEGLWTSNYVVWVTLGAEQVLMTHSSHIATAFSLKPRTGRVLGLERHFENLTPDKNIRDPWFEEYWSSVFHCRGNTCKSKTSQTLATDNLRQNPDVPNIINSVLAVGHALQTVRREMCPDHVVGRSFCRPMADVSRVRSRLLEILPRMAFVGAGPRAVAFSSMGESSNSGIEVVMFESSNFSPKLIADIDSKGTVTWIEEDALKDYENLNDDNSCEVPFNLTIITPKPTEVAKKPEVPGEINGYAFQVEGTGNSSTALLAVLPVHRRGEAGFRCGDLNESSVCAAVTVLYASLVAKRNNSNGDSLGISIVDSCSQPERAFSSLFSILATSPLPQFAAALILDPKDVEAVKPLLTAQGIPQVPHSSALEDARSGNPKPEPRAREASLAAALLDVAAALEGPSTIVVHGSSPKARSLARAVESASLASCAGDVIGDSGVCLSAVLPAPPMLHIGSETRPGAQYLLASQVPGAVVIVAPASADDIRALLVAAQSPLVPRLTFVVPVATSRHAASLRVVGHSVLSVVPDATVVEPSSELDEAASENITSAEITDSETSFERWLLKPDGLQSSGLPTTWLAHLDVARCAQEQGPWKVSDLVKLVSMIDSAQNKSVSNMTTGSIVEAMSRTDINPEVLEEVTTFKIWHNVEPVGSWTSERRLTLTTHPDVLLLEESMASGRPSALHNMQFIWALVLGAVALLGMLLTLATAVFFLSAAAVARTPISGSAGTSVLGYLILLALLVLHGGVFSVVLAPSEASCGARRLFPAAAYALIFSAMFLKVLTTWQMCERKGVALGPMSLILRALVLAAPQFLVSIGWIVFVPPVVHSVPAASGTTGTVWLCYPATAGDADMHQLLSMAYTCLLMVATAVVALLCSSKEELLEEGTMLHQESRSILAAALAVAVQLGCWGLAIVALMPGSSHPLREPVAAGVHTAAAATLLACLFLPKLRLYLRLKRNARDAANIAASAAARPQTIYGVSHFQQPFGGKMNPVDMFVGDSASTAASHTASDSSSTSAGHYSDPTQAIPSSLYSLDMFTGPNGIPPDVPLEEPQVQVGTLRSVRSDVHHVQCGTLRAASLTGTLRGNVLGATLGGTLRGDIGGTLKGNFGGTLRGNIGGTLRANRSGMHCMPGTNEFTPSHRTSSTLLLPSQEGVSYM